MAVSLKSKPASAGIAFGEGPRWHNNKLIFSDMHAEKVLSYDPQTKKLETVVNLPALERPSGLGWLPDGSLVIVEMLSRRVLRYKDGKLSTYADLSHLSKTSINDMVVSAAGDAYIGNFGFDMDEATKKHGWKWVKEHAMDSENLGVIIRVDVNGKASIAAKDMAFPNGPVIVPGTNLYLVGETMGRRVTAFNIAKDGSFTNRRIWATTGKVMPDGTCWDDRAKGLWVGNGGGKNVTLFAEGGAALAVVDCTGLGIACAVGGPSMSTLFILSAPNASADQRRGKTDALIEEVDVSGVQAARARV